MARSTQGKLPETGIRNIPPNCGLSGRSLVCELATLGKAPSLGANLRFPDFAAFKMACVIQAPVGSFHEKRNVLQD
jgi:hypothetical protein